MTVVERRVDYVTRCLNCGAFEPLMLRETPSSR